MNFESCMQPTIVLGFSNPFFYAPADVRCPSPLFLDPPVLVAAASPASPAAVPSPSSDSDSLSDSPSLHESSSPQQSSPSPQQSRKQRERRRERQQRGKVVSVLSRQDKREKQEKHRAVELRRRQRTTVLFSRLRDLTAQPEADKADTLEAAVSLIEYLLQKQNRTQV